MARKWWKKRSDKEDRNHVVDEEVYVHESSDDGLKSLSTASATFSPGGLCFGRRRAQASQVSIWTPMDPYKDPCIFSFPYPTNAKQCIPLQR